jgi:DNA helicase-2/ATP-dependent DNA helicase PcrA
MGCSRVSEVANDFLDDEQRAAAFSPLPAIAVLAGPGSGKTRVLSCRVSHLLTSDSDANALLLTFTNKAAAEMKARALTLAPVSSSRMLACTFHTFGMRVLKAHGDMLGIERDFEILSEEERKQFTTDLTAGADYGDRYTRWSYLRVRGLPVEDPEVNAFGAAYEAAKRAERVVDFDDLVVSVADLFNRFPDIAGAYASRYPHLLADEFQDTNAVQFSIVQAMANSARTVSVFADDDQAIYRFAGAESANIRRFLEELGAEEFPLTFNYRCRSVIVDCANSLIRSDPAASGRQMTAHHQGGEVKVRAFGSVREEAAVLGQEIEALITTDGVPPQDIAVLGRSAPRLQYLLRELRQRGVLASDWLGAAYEPVERVAVRTCFSVVRGALSKRQLDRLRVFVNLEQVQSPETVDELLSANVAQPGIAELARLRDEAWQGASVSELLEAARQVVDIVSPEASVGVAELCASMAAFSEQDPDFSVEHLLAELALGGSGGAPTVGGGVKVATLHRTKGLQWPIVFMIGVEAGKLPDYRATDEAALSDERRTCFVGVCRAEERLTLSWSRTSGNYRGYPSRFIREMGLTET